MTGTATPGAGYLSHPAIRGGQVVFVCEDDLWLVADTGGQAFRLTASVAEATHPRLSPDGAWVAFTGTQDGTSEVYVMPLEGGPAHRLTVQAARCAVLGWHPGGGEILYASPAEQPPGFGTRIFAVDPRGGLPRPMPYGPTTAIAHGPGGALVLGRNTGDPARWKRYRGGTAGELWIGSHQDGALFSRLLNLPGNPASPCWAGERVFFVCDHEGTGNVYSCRADGSDLTRHTDHDEFYARNLTSDGARLVYQAGARLYLLDPAEGGPRPIDVRLRTSRTQHDRRFVSASGFLEDAALSHDGTALALTTRGKLFTLAHWEGPVRQHGAPDAVRYRLPAWLTDGERLVASAGDERPEECLVVFDAGTDSPSAPREPALPDLGRPTELAPSPTVDLVAVATHRQQLHLVNLGPGNGDPGAGPSARLLDRSPHGRIEDLAWSVDGRWLAYTWPAGPHCSIIKVADARTGAVHRVTEPVLRDFAPCFDPRGHFLYFLGRRECTPVADALTFGFGFAQAVRPYLVALRDGEPSPFAARPRSPAKEPVVQGAHDEDDPEPLEIDFAGISGRIAPFPLPEGDYRRILSTYNKILLLSFPVPPGAGDPTRPPADGDEEKPSGLVESFDPATLETSELLDRVTDMRLNRDRDTLLCQAGARLRVVKAEPKPEDVLGDAVDEPGRATGWIDLDRVRVAVRPHAEWRQMFREAWRLQHEHFWDPGMAGVDWETVYERYVPLVDLVGSRAELSDLLWELQGELGTSHAYEFGGDYRAGPRYRQGLLGVDWVTGDGSGARVARIVAGDRWDPRATSPCTSLGADIRPGDLVTAVNGQPVGPAGPGELLVDQAGREVELTVSRPGAGERHAAVHRLTLRTLGDEGPARYRDWVAQNRSYVHEATGGRIGYLHVPDMFETGYAEFVRSFLTEYDREALIVDARFNGGGFVSWLVLERLARRRRGYEFGRWSGALPYPAESPRGPMVALVNEHTGSDGDIFGHMFREMRLGPLVGRRTWGGVIAVHPRHPLVDGTVTTQPEYSYVFDGVGRLLENRGVEPDLDVEIAPHDHVLGLDTQLARAVEVALEEAAEKPPHSPPQPTRTTGD
ncbi:MAG: S41 family peptidase [Frankiaceae bacterium]